MILKKYMISATVVAVLTGSMASQGFIHSEAKEETVIEKSVKQSGVSISVSDKTIKKGSKFNPKAGVTAKDYNGKDITKYIIVTHNNVNENKVGTYKVGYAVLGSNGKRVDVEITVKVVDDSNEEIKTVITADDIVISKGSSFNPLKGVKATDITGKDITKYILVNQNTVNTSEEGTYTVKYLVLDTQGNRVYKTRTVTVKGSGSITTKETVITAKDKTIEKGSIFNPMEGIKAIDVTGKDITKYVLVVENTVNSDVVSVGTVKYLVLDTQGNRVYKTIKVTVSNGVDTPKTEILANDVTIHVGDNFDERDGVKAIDITGKDITRYILITKNDVNTEKTGKYNVTYLVLDTEGNRVYKTRTVTVVASLDDIEKAQNVIDKIDSLSLDVVYSDLLEIRSVREEYNKLSNDAKNLVTNYSKLEEVESKLEVKINKVSNVNQMISDLPADITLDYKTQVQEVRNAYEYLTDDEKEAISHEQLSILLSSEVKIAELEKVESDKILAKELVDRIDKLNDEIQYTDKDEIKDIRNKYESLVLEAKDLVTNYAKLIDSENKLNSIMEKINNVINSIYSLPEKITLDHKTQVQEVRQAYVDLGEVNQKGVDNITLSVLIDAEIEIKRLESIRDSVEAQEFIAEMEGLPALELITIEHKAEVFRVREIYRNLPEDIKPLIDITDLMNAVDKVEVFMAEEVVSEIELLPAIEDLQVTDKSTVTAIRAKYNEISIRNNKRVTNLGKLEKAEARILELENIINVDYVINAINNLPEVVDIQWSHQNVIVDARNAFSQLNESDRLMVTNINKLEDAEAEYNRINDGINAVLTAINLIPELENLTLVEKQTVVDARNLYKSYDEKVTYYINQLALKKLINAETKIENLEKLEADQQAKALVEKIDRLLNKTLTEDDIEEVLGLREEYNLLSPESQKLISLSLIEELELRISEI